MLPIKSHYECDDLDESLEQWKHQQFRKIMGFDEEESVRSSIEFRYSIAKSWIGKIRDLYLLQGAIYAELVWDKDLELMFMDSPEE